MRGQETLDFQPESGQIDGYLQRSKKKPSWSKVFSGVHMSSPEVLGHLDGRGVMWLNLPARRCRLVDRRKARSRAPSPSLGCPSSAQPVAA